MNEMGRLFAAVLISMGAIFAWNYLYVDPKLKAQIEQQEKAKEVVSASASASVSLNNNSSVNNLPNNATQNNINNSITSTSTSTATSTNTPTLSREEIIARGFASGERIKINTDKLHGSISLVGAVVDDLTLARYRQELDKNSAEVVLLSPKRTKDVYYFYTGWIAADGKTIVPTENTKWQLQSGDELAVGKPVVLTYDNGAGIVFTKTIEIDDKYLISIKQNVNNKTADIINIAPFGLINRTRDLETKDMYVSHEGMIAVADKQLKEEKYKSMVKEPNISFPSVSGWIGVGDKYWLTSVIPQNSATDKFDVSFKYYKKDGVDRFQNDILGKPTIISANSSLDYSFNVYAGAKRLKYIEGYQKEFNIDLFDRSIDFGALYFLTKPIFKSLNYFHDLVGNMGYAIMLLTVVIRLILFPLANMSYKSMARMKKHMPEISAIREKHKNDRQKQGTEMMKYYKTHRINPAAGCLPILLQIPVFFALYKVLYVTIEMRHEPFIWFVNDLSAQDPTNILTLFGLIAWNVPTWLPHIGILPILFSLTMVIQTKLNPPMVDETQKIIMAWLPWIFLFVFANFAAGLVIYWIWNNILSILQQYLITKKINADKSE
jgi:YidC/Oxa1 family membrane protein insertase